ncbi:MAG: AMP-dependent synthetase/ligase [Bifidobacteriaceae bacterium]|jgi:long-chain acyl-CoA synthetase|nr:AMP-dependent synthetase/ligase [Bifidobacteriaceae bacterium]
MVTEFVDTVSTPPTLEVDPNWNIWTLLDRRVRETPDATAIEVRREDGGWEPITARQFAAEASQVAKGMVALGIGAGDRVAIMSRTRYEWTVLDYAIWAAGAVPVPIYETSSVEQIGWICSDAEICAIFVETDAHRLLVDAARASLPGLTRVWEIDKGDVAALKEVGAPVDDSLIAERRGLAAGPDLATIIYTSGTTGRPKGTELTHGNFVRLIENTQWDQTEATLREVVAVPGCRTLLFLPLAHVFARFIEVLSISGCTVIGHCPDTRTLMPAIQTFRPTFLLAVPRVLEKVYNAAEVKAGKGAKLKLFRLAAKIAIVYSRSLDTPRGPGLSLKARHKLFDRLVYSSLRTALGGNTRFAVSGGAPLGERLGHFYRGIGLIVLEGYGLTETTAPILVNRPSKLKIGSVGIPFPGCAVRIADDGEICVQGVNVFGAYHNNPEATAEALRDGWFATGDVGRLDEDGYLFITGRKKEIIVTAGGKNVAPAVLEDRLRGHPLVSQTVVVGDNKPFIAALVTLDEEMLPGWLGIHGLPDMTPEEARADADVLAALERAVARANQAVSRAESIRKFTILDRDFTEVNGYLTPSLKVKRSLVLRDFSPQVEALYAEATAGGPGAG